MACWWGCSARKLFNDLMYCREEEGEHRHISQLPGLWAPWRDGGAGPRPQTVPAIPGGTHGFFDDVEALLVDLKGGHLLDDLLQEDVLFIAVAFD